MCFKAMFSNSLQAGYMDLLNLNANICILISGPEDENGGHLGLAKAAASDCEGQQLQASDINTRDQLECAGAAGIDCLMYCTAQCLPHS